MSGLKVDKVTGEWKKLILNLQFHKWEGFLDQMGTLSVSQEKLVFMELASNVCLTSRLVQYLPT